MWTEVATGAEARGVRRWLRRVLVPILLRYVIVFVLVLLLVAAWGVYARYEWMRQTVHLLY